MTADAPARQRWALAAAVAVVLVAVVIVAVFGLVPYPEVPTVGARPNPPVTALLAYVDYEASGGPCLRLVDGRGREREVGCGMSYGGELRWLDAERLAVATFPPPEGTARVVDVDSGEVVEVLEEPLEPPGATDTSPDGARAIAGGRDGQVWLQVTEPDGSTRRVLELDGPSTYALYQTAWSSDGDWIVVLDSIERLLVVDAAGALAPRVWAESLGPFAVS